MFYSLTRSGGLFVINICNGHDTKYASRNIEAKWLKTKRYLIKILLGWQRCWCFSSAGDRNGSLHYHSSCRVLLGVQGRLGKRECKAHPITVTAGKKPKNVDNAWPAIIHPHSPDGQGESPAKRGNVQLWSEGQKGSATPYISYLCILMSSCSCKLVSLFPGVLVP